jgi:hypothetical protein
MEASSLIGVERGEHAFLNGGDGCGGAVKPPRPVVGEGEALVATTVVALDEVKALERGEQLVHRLAGDEGAAGKLGVGEPGLVGELLQARVLRDGQVVLAQRGVHRGSEGDGGALKHIADCRIEIHLTHVNILTYAGCQDIDE